MVLEVSEGFLDERKVGPLYSLVFEGVVCSLGKYRDGTCTGVEDEVALVASFLLILLFVIVCRKDEGMFLLEGRSDCNKASVVRIDFD